MSTETITQKTSPQITVIYDENCLFCNFFADYLRKKFPQLFEVIPYGEFLKRNEAMNAPIPNLPQKPENLGLIKDGENHWGNKAWEILLLNFPHISSLSWLAQKMGILGVTSRVINTSGHVIRRMCFRCRR